MAVSTSESKDSTRVPSSTPSSTTSATESDPQKVDVAKRVDTKSDADAGRIADRITGSGDTIEVSARAQLKADAPVTATADVDAAYADADRALQDMSDLQWGRNEDAAREQADRLRDVTARLPEADRTPFLESAMRPVHDYIRNTGLTNLESMNPGVDPERARIVGQFSDMIGQPGLDALGNVLQNNADDPASRNAVLGTLGKIADTNRDESIRSGAARTIFAGPLDGIRDGLAGNIPGLSVEKLGELTDRYGDLQSDQRLLTASNGLDPSVRQSLEARGIREATMFADNSVLHDVLDYAGLAPVIGTVADGINAVVYGAEGRLGDAVTTMLPSALGAGVTVGRVVDRATSLGQSLATRAERLGLRLGRDEGLVYEHFTKHPPRDPSRSIDSYGHRAPAPRNGQFGLDTSVPVSQRTRISADPVNREFNVYNLTGGSVWHGHTRTWNSLDADMRGRLIQMQIVDRRGRFLVTE